MNSDSGEKLVLNVDVTLLRIEATSSLSMNVAGQNQGSHSIYNIFFQDFSRTTY